MDKKKIKQIKESLDLVIQKDNENETRKKPAKNWDRTKLY